MTFNVRGVRFQFQWLGIYCRPPFLVHINLRGQFWSLGSKSNFQSSFTKLHIFVFVHWGSLWALHTLVKPSSPCAKSQHAPALLSIFFFLSSSPGTWDKSCSVPPSTRQTTWPLLNSVTWTQPQPSAVTTSLSVEGEKNRLKSTCTWKQQASWSNSKGHNLSGFFFLKKKYFRDCRNFSYGAGNGWAVWHLKCFGGGVSIGWSGWQRRSLAH